jgi:citrate lyase subunit beta/citryl-CoA lyase
MMEKAARSDADEVMLDLEDAVAPGEKVAARAKVVDAIHDLDWSDKVLAVRINGLGTRYAYGDLVEVVEGAGAALDVVVVPKVEHARDVYVVETLLGQLEANLGLDEEIAIEVLVEETAAMQHVDAIAAASDRLEALIFGPGDYSAAQGVDLSAIGNRDEDGYPGDIWHYARNRIVIAARANGLDAIDGPFPDFSDPDGYRQECRHSSLLGFVGKWAIHPSQIAIANEVYAPAPDVVDRARRVVDAMERGAAAGRGAVQLDGQMLDEATVRSARRTLERARAVGLLE